MLVRLYQNKTCALAADAAYCLLQCVRESASCDFKQQCVDGSDEQRCPSAVVFRRDSETPPILVEFRGLGLITSTTMQPATGHVDVACPETHFWCADKALCLPVFVRCNGVYDCPGHEDEEDCDRYTCPGFYRCRASKVCVHVTHVCDDWPMCPQLDDELLCGQSCPLHCACHGAAFFCRRQFAADQHPDLRYLDARGSGMDVHQLVNNRLLIHLSLATCNLKSISNFTFPNLHSLDLSDNLLTEVCGHHFKHMPHLTVLFLAGNPFTYVFRAPVSSSFNLHNMHIVDFSRVKLSLKVQRLFLAFPNLHTLNLSHSSVSLLQRNSSNLPSLRELDLRGSVITEFPRDLLRGFLHLQLLFADSFKFCCPAVLRTGFDFNRCHTNPDDVSSCDSLLGSVTYRASVAVLATLSLMGNVVSLTARVCVGSMWRLSSSGVVLTHLSVADLGTGLYLATLGLADRWLDGHYVWRDEWWRSGAVCQLAGVLAVSCRHAAVLFTTVLCLHHCLHTYPAVTALLTPAKVKLVCVVVWASSLLLSLVPLTPQWRFYGQQALCAPLPHQRHGFLETQYAYGVMVYVPLVMFVLCSLCQVVSGVTGRATHINIMNRDTGESQFVVLGSVATGFLHTAACLVPTHSSTDRQRATHTALVFFGFVVSCAVNPYLHLCGVRVENRKRVKEQRLLRIVNRTRC